MTDAAPAETASNIYARDYVGPDACGKCHTDKLQSWQTTFHATMNQIASSRSILSRFDNASLSVAGGRATFTRDATDTFFMTLAPPGRPTRRFRVTRTIGTVYLQEYVGVEVGVADPVEIRLPFGWYMRGGGWYQQQYYDSWFGPEATVDSWKLDESPWATRCAWCHNTYPFELRALRPKLGEGPEQYFDVTPRRPPEAVKSIAEGNLLPVGEILTVGISCESCHLGGREHATLGNDISFVPVSPDLKKKAGAPDLTGGRKNNVVVNTICAQCHSTPSPRYANGAVARNSSEALDMAGGSCMTQIKCTDCHDPHGQNPRKPAPCLECHDQLEAVDAAEKHAGHSLQVAYCLDCHMPTIVQGISNMTRSHHIGPPSAGSPNACNLCHLDKSLAWTAEELRTRWGMKVDAPKGDEPAGLVWLRSSDRSVRLAAAGAYGSVRPKGAVQALLSVLDDPVAYDRMRYLFALEEALDHRLSRSEYDPTASAAVRAAQVRKLKASAGR